MGKRSTGQFIRNVHDLYNTRDPRAVVPLLPFLRPGMRYIEPCFGKGALFEQLAAHGFRCVLASDIEEPEPVKGVAFRIADATAEDYGQTFPEAAFEGFITNPPWTRAILHAIIENLAQQAPTWLLFDADWAFRKTTSKALLDMCSHIIAVGRIRWMLGEPGDKGQDPKDNCAWYRFDARHTGGPRFYGRGE